MIQLKVAVMTVYDEEEQIIERVKLHDYPIRSAFLQVLSEQTEEMMLQPEFRESLALRLKNTINEVLTEIEGSGGVEAVYFTEFLIQ
jgi:flagellar FliL protein